MTTLNPFLLHRAANDPMYAGNPPKSLILKYLNWWILPRLRGIESALQ
jgi:hypothetical protein